MEGSNLRVGLVVDHPKRDLAGAVLIARSLVARGLDAVLVPQYEQAVDVPLLGLDALVINYARPVNFEIVSNFAQAGVAVYVLDTEGGVLADDGPSTPHRLAAYISESGYSDVLAGYFFWGPVLRDAFIENSGLPASRLHLTGCPRFDFAAPMLRRTTPPRRKGHILVNTNYPAVNPKFTGPARDDRVALAAVGYGGDYIGRLLGDTADIMRGMIATVQRLSSDLAEQEILFRPHPFENENAYRQAFADRPNVTVDGRGDVIEAMKGARALLHVNCGTAIEAIMLEVPPLSLEFLNTEHMRRHASLPSRASRRVESYDELRAMLDAGTEADGYDFEGRYREFVAPWFYLNDGRAAERVADVLARELTCLPRARKHAALSRSVAASRARPSLGQRGQAVLSNLVGSLAASRVRASVQRHRREKALDLPQLRRMIDGLSGDAPAQLARAKHPVTRTPLASLVVHASGAPPEAGGRKASR